VRRDAEHTSANDHALEATAGGAELLTGALGLLLHVAAMVAVMAVVALVVYKAGRDRPAQGVINLDGVWRAPSCWPEC
jgi:hypothetical protein